MPFNGRKVLIIAPKFFGYEKLIQLELESQGAFVDYFDDRPGGDFLTKALIRVDRRLLARRTNRYYGSIVANTNGRDYDDILIVRAEAISSEQLLALKATHPRARAILYLWDSMNYNPNARKLLKHFDCVWSFDRDDANAYPQVGFLPLFYARGFTRTRYPADSFKYDACFIGTVHTDRYKVLERMVSRLEAQGRKVLLYCYYPSTTLFRLRSLLDGGFRRFGRKYVKFQSIPLSQTIDYFDHSLAIIDINRPAQLGLTMRTIEALGARRKLITTNRDVENYDLYDPSYVAVVDRDNPVLPDDFFDEKALAIDEKVWNKYSIEKWVEQVFSRDA